MKMTTNYRVESHNTCYAVERTNASGRDIATGRAVWSSISQWETYEEAFAELVRLHNPPSLLALYATCEPIFAALIAEATADVERGRANDIQHYEDGRRFCDRPYQLTTTYVDAQIAILRSTDYSASIAEAALLRLGKTDKGAALLAAINAAQWGAQADGTFVTFSHNAHWIADSGDTCTVCAPAKQGELVAASVHHDGARFVSFASRADARAKRDAQKAASRVAQERYVTNLDVAATMLRTTGARWAATGAFGGTLYIEDHAGDLTDERLEHVSTRGALARAWGVRCTCGRRAGHHAERLPVVPCEACDRAEAFGAIADRFRAAMPSERDVWLFTDGAYCDVDGVAHVIGPLARAEAERVNASLSDSLRSEIRWWTP
jgi:hypothetical protein